MPAYDSELFDPPAPVALVTIRHSETQAAALDVPMLLDSGADVSLLPRRVVEQLSLTSSTDVRYELVSFDGSLSSSAAVQAEVVFLQRTFRGQFLIIEQPLGVLGRNVLNATRLILDGPNLLWDEF